MSSKKNGRTLSLQDTDNVNPPQRTGKEQKNPLALIRKFCISRTFMLIICLAATLFIIFSAEVAGAVFFVLLLSALLFLCDDILTTTMPFLALSVTVLQCYDSFNTFIKFAPLAVIPVSALIYHFVKYRKKVMIGIGFYGIVAVAVAVTFGGLGTIPVDEYFSGTALFYVAALGVGMIVVYLLLRPALAEKRSYDIREKIIDIMYFTGILACFQIIVVYGECMLFDSRDFLEDMMLGDGKYFYEGMKLSDIAREFTEGGLFGFYSKYFAIRLQPSNNVSTFIMLALPFPLYRAVKGNKLHLLTTLLMMVCLVMTKSRGGIILGFAELLICLVCMALISENRAVKWIFIAIPALASVGAAYFVIASGMLENIYKLIPESDARVQLILRSFRDFERNPVFGQGIGNMSNSDLYNGKAGTIPWYHMMIPQIIGSMGCVGISAYAWQFYTRVRLTVRKFTPFVMTLALSYMGLLMMSQVNPGEFCPLPYGIVAVILFIIIENQPDTFAVKAKR